MNSNKYYVVYAYIEHFLIVNHMSENEFCKRLRTSKDTLLLLKCKNYQNFPLRVLLDICEYTKIPLSKLVVNLEEY